MTAAPKRPRLEGLERLPKRWRGGVVAIGNFDGVHRGHQAVLRAARAEAKRLAAPCLMLTFEPHPRAFFSGRPVFRLTPAPLKAALSAALGIEGTLVLPFSHGLAAMSAEDFVRGILIGRLAIRAAVTGHDFHFGKSRSGTPQFLAEQGKLNGFGVEIVEALTESAAAVSATRVRSALAQADVATANRLLGWSFAVAGEVVRGDGRGRDLGYPTANMTLDKASELAEGIYAVRFLGPDGVLRDGVASYGRRPMFGGGEPVLETFVFDFSGDLYGQTALVAFHDFIRREERFESVAALIARMDEDSLAARAALERAPPGDLDRKLHAAWRDMHA
jgi:riboflavin kinase/FMN adenylyltransferase